MSEFRPTVATIQLRHLQANFQQFRSWLEPGAFLCPMVKANAYGMGDVAVVKSLREVGAEIFGIALVEEGLHLREQGIEDPLLLFGGFSRRAVRLIVDARLTPVLSRWDEIEALEAELHARAGFSVHLKFNTGMNRLGFSPSEAERLLCHFRQSDRLRLAGVCTHLHTGEDILKADGSSRVQLTLFSQLADLFCEFSPLEHSLNSVALMALHIAGRPSWAKRWLRGVRPGIGLYGANPDRTGLPSLKLRPVLQWETEIVMVRTIQQGESVSYGGRWRAPSEAKIAVLPVGYADGYSRLLSNRGEVLIRGQRVPVVGTVCMDYIVINLSHLSNADEIDVGEPVVLAGEQGQDFIGVEELAELGQTISYEILTGLGQRVSRCYVK